MAKINDPEEIKAALLSAKTVAVVGCSPNPARASNGISRFLMRMGYTVLPVNPGHREILGQTCYRSLDDIPKEIVVDVVNVFRRSEFVAPVAEAALRRGTVTLFFMQDGVYDASSARLVASAGIPVAMDRCIYRDRSALQYQDSIL
jgi:predicted CoA-binding protein